MTCPAQGMELLEDKEVTAVEDSQQGSPSAGELLGQGHPDRAKLAEVGLEVVHLVRQEADHQDSQAVDRLDTLVVVASQGSQEVECQTLTRGEGEQTTL